MSDQLCACLGRLSKSMRIQILALPLAVAFELIYQIFKFCLLLTDNLLEELSCSELKSKVYNNDCSRLFHMAHSILGDTQNPPRFGYALIVSIVAVDTLIIVHLSLNVLHPPYHQAMHTTFKLVHTIFRYVPSLFNHVLIIPILVISVRFSSTNVYLSVISFVLTLIISYLCCQNCYEYTFNSRNKMARRYSHFQFYLITLEAIDCILYFEAHYKVTLFFVAITNFVSLLEIYYEFPYYNHLMQKLNISCSLGNFIVSLTFLAAVGYNSNSDGQLKFPITLALLASLPLAYKLGMLYYNFYLADAEQQIQACINTDFLEYFNPNKLDIYVRTMYARNKLNFKFAHLFHNPKSAIFLQTILAAAAPSENQESEKEQLLGLGRQREVILEFLRELYKKILREFSPSQKSADFTFAYLSFLIEVYRKRTVAYLEILNEKNNNLTKQKSLREKQAVNEILAVAERTFKHEQFMNDHINVRQIIEHDAYIGRNQELLEECLKQKKDLVNFMSKNFMDITKFSKKAKHLLNNRNKLRKHLMKSTTQNPDNIMLKEQISNYLFYLSMGDEKSKDFLGNSSKYHKNQIYFKARRSRDRLLNDQSIYTSNRYSIVYITLVGNIGQVKGVSDTFEKMFGFNKSEIISKDINLIIPPVIAIRHSMILNGFVRRGANNHNFQNFRLVFGQNKRGFVIPVMLKLKIEVVGKDDFGVSGIFRKVNERQNYMMISESFNICGISEGIFQDMFKKHYSLQEIKQFNITKIFPLFLATIQNQEEIKAEEEEQQLLIEENEEMDAKEIAEIRFKLSQKKKQEEEMIYESIILVNYSKQARSQLQQRTHSIEKDIQDIRLQQSQVYRVLFKTQLSQQHGFKYYCISFIDYIHIPRHSEFYLEAIGILAEQLEEAYQIPEDHLIELVKQSTTVHFSQQNSQKSQGKEQKQLQQQQPSQFIGSISFDLQKETSLNLIVSNKNKEEKRINLQQQNKLTNVTANKCVSLVNIDDHAMISPTQLQAQQQESVELLHGQTHMDPPTVVEETSYDEKHNYSTQKKIMFKDEEELETNSKLDMSLHATAFAEKQLTITNAIAQNSGMSNRIQAKVCQSEKILEENKLRLEQEDIKVQNSIGVTDLDPVRIKEANRNIIASGIIGFLKRKTFVKGAKNDGSNGNIEGDKNGKNNSDLNPISEDPHIGTSSQQSEQQLFPPPNKFNARLQRYARKLHFNLQKQPNRDIKSKLFLTKKSTEGWAKTVEDRDKNNEDSSSNENNNSNSNKTAKSKAKLDVLGNTMNNIDLKNSPETQTKKEMMKNLTQRIKDSGSINNIQSSDTSEEEDEKNQRSEEGLKENDEKERVDKQRLELLMKSNFKETSIKITIQDLLARQKQALDQTPRNDKNPISTNTNSNNVPLESVPNRISNTNFNTIANNNNYKITNSTVQNALLSQTQNITDLNELYSPRVIETPTTRRSLLQNLPKGNKFYNFQETTWKDSSLIIPGNNNTIEQQQQTAVLNKDSPRILGHNAGELSSPIVSPLSTIPGKTDVDKKSQFRNANKDNSNSNIRSLKDLMRLPSQTSEKTKQYSKMELRSKGQLPENPVENINENKNDIDVDVDDCEDEEDEDDSNIEDLSSKEKNNGRRKQNGSYGEEDKEKDHENSEVSSQNKEKQQTHGVTHHTKRTAQDLDEKNLYTNKGYTNTSLHYSNSKELTSKQGTKMVPGKKKNEQKKSENNKKRFQLQLKNDDEEEDGKSQQSEASRSSHFTQKKIMSLITSKKGDSIIMGFTILGFSLLLGIGLGTLLMYLSLTSNLSQMENNLTYVSWPMDVKCQILQVIKGEALLKYLQNNVFGYSPTVVASYLSVANSQIAENYQRLWELLNDIFSKDIYSYKLFHNLQSVQSAVTIVDYTIYSLNTPLTTTKIHSTLAQSLMLIRSSLFSLIVKRIDTVNDETNIVINYGQIVDKLEYLSGILITDQERLASKTHDRLYLSLFGMMGLSIIFSISIFPLYLIIRHNSQRVLKFFATFQPEILLQMHMHLNSFARNFKASSSYTMNQKLFLAFSSILIEKKRGISDTSDIRKFKKLHVLIAVLFFVLIIIYPMFNFFLTNKFVNEQLQNVILLEKLRYVISLSVESLESNYLISYKKMFPTSYPGLNLTWYQSEGLHHVNQSRLALDELQEVVKNQHTLTRKYQTQFDQFVMKIIEGNACNVINEWPSYFASTDHRVDLIDYASCVSLRNGIFKQGLILSLNDMFNIIPQVTQFYYVTNPVVYRAILAQFQKVLNILDLDRFNVILDQFVDAQRDFIITFSRDYFNSMFQVQIILLCYQLTVLLLIFYFGWRRFCQQLQDQLFVSKRMFSLLHISFLVDNPYFFSYYSNKKFKI